MRFLSSLILVILTVLVVTVVISRVSQPTEVSVVEGVYEEFFGSTPHEPLHLLEIKNGRLILHCENAHNLEVRLTIDGKERLACSNGKEEQRDFSEKGIAFLTLTLEPTPIPSILNTPSSSCTNILYFSRSV